MSHLLRALAIVALYSSALAQSAPDPLGLGTLAANRPPGSKTEITAQKEASFEEKTNTATFYGDVRVNDPSFLLRADKLTVTLTADRSGMERAVAEGNVVIVQQTTQDREKAAVGRGQRAEYTPANGKVVLSGQPEIQQGINRHIATSPSTRMVIYRDGRATTEGPSRTVITDNAKPTLP